MARIKIKHPSPTDQAKRNLLYILSKREVYATRVEQVRDGFVIITSTEAETDTLFKPPCLEELKGESFEPILPPDQQAKRAILCFGVDDYIKGHTEAEIKEEIYRANDFTEGRIESVQKFDRQPIIKIIFTETAPALKCKEHGVKMFNMRIPHHRIQEQEYTPINTCMRCYSIEQHFTNKCPKPREYNICSECTSHQHKWYECEASEKKCVNCGGRHSTLAYKCPRRKEAVAAAKEKKKTTELRGYSNAVSSNTTPATQPLFSPEAASRILTCLLQAHLTNISTPGSFATTLNQWLELNNLPKVNAPENPDSFRIMAPGVLLPANTAALIPEAAATVVEENGDEDDDTESEAEPDMDEEEEEDETPTEEPPQRTATPKLRPCHPPYSKPSQTQKKYPTTSSHSTSSTSHTPANRPQSNNTSPTVPSSAPPKRDKTPAKPRGRPPRNH